MYSARPIEQDDHRWAPLQSQKWLLVPAEQLVKQEKKKIKLVHTYKYTGNAKVYYIQANEISDF